MGVARLARRSFGFAAAGLLGVSVYFQAAGAAELVVAQTLLVFAGATPGAVRTGGSPRLPAATSRSSTNGGAILTRNPFDSVTGSLDRVAIELVRAEAAKPSPELSDPLNAPPCPDVTVKIVTESSDPEWSVAQIEGPGDVEASARRVGDLVGEREVAYIGFNDARLSPAVWLRGEKSLCNALLFSGGGDTAADTRPSASAGGARARDEGRSHTRRSRASSGAALPAEIAAKIQRISDTELVVERSVIDFVLENQGQLLGASRVVPEREDGTTVGIRLLEIEPDTLLGALGLLSGDRLESVNGHDVSSPANALEAYAELPTASSLEIRLTRRGTPTTLDIEIR